jgi:hypothetical protein
VAHELDRHAAPLVDRRLERKDHQHAIGNGANGREPSGARRPDLRADVVDDRNPEPFDRRRQAEVEPGEIDEDERVRAFRPRRRDEAAPGREQSRQLGDPRDHAGDRELAVVIDEKAAGGREPGAAESGDGQRGVEREELVRQRAGVEVAGRLTAGQEEANAQMPKRRGV